MCVTGLPIFLQQMWSPRAHWNCGVPGLEGTLRGQLSRSSRPKQPMVTALVAMVTALCSWESDDCQQAPSCLGHTSSKPVAAAVAFAGRPWEAGGVLTGGRGCGLGSLFEAPEVSVQCFLQDLRADTCVHLWCAVPSLKSGEPDGTYSWRTRSKQSPNLPSGSDSKESAHNAGDPGSVPGSGRSLGEGHGYLLQYSCLENPTDTGAW